MRSASSASSPSIGRTAGPVGVRSRLSAALLSPWAKPVAWVLLLLPLAWLVGLTVTDGLGANPAEALIRATGDWTLRLLCGVLAVTPLRVIGRLPALARFRRLLGLFAFSYALVHLACYSLFDMGLEWGDIGRDILKRPFILVGFTACVLMLPLALSSFNAAIKAMGGRRWQALHRAVYAVVLLGLLHFFWMRAGKHNFAEVAVYAAVISVLLGWRLQQAWRKRRRGAGESRA